MRLKSVMPGVVLGIFSENQSAFVPGRLITDNALIALELFDTMKTGVNAKRAQLR